MIVCKAPLRITLGGGGTDLPSFYSKNGGLCLTAAINKYIYIALHESFENNFILKYSNFERCRKIKSIKHPLLRETLKYLNFKGPHLEIASFADVPSGTGLGSSAAFTVCLINAIQNYLKKKISHKKIAKIACDIEINKLRIPVGKQDQFACSFGGLQKIRINRKGNVNISKIKISKSNMDKLQNNIIMFYSGNRRVKHDVLKEQQKASEKNQSQMINNLLEVKEIGEKSLNYLERGLLDDFGKIMHDHWKLKLKRSKDISNDQINKLYEYAHKNGALGGKLIGAGGAGFLLFYSNDTKHLENRFKSKFNIDKFNFKFDFNGLIKFN